MDSEITHRARELRRSGMMRAVGSDEVWNGGRRRRAR